MIKDEAPLLNIVLVEPEIPQNTGNIGRTCVSTRAHLHLVGKLGFEINDKNVKRAGLDYWPHLKWFQYPDLATWSSKVPDLSRVFYFSAKVTQPHYDVQYQKGDWLVFGKETKGLPEDLLRQNSGQCLQIPILGPVRGLNLATAVAVAAYEGIRQLENRGELSRSSFWTYS